MSLNKKLDIFLDKLPNLKNWLIRNDIDFELQTYVFHEIGNYIEFLFENKKEREVKDIFYNLSELYIENDISINDSIISGTLERLMDSDELIKKSFHNLEEPLKSKFIEICKDTTNRTKDFYKSL